MSERCHPAPRKCCTCSCQTRTSVKLTQRNVRLQCAVHTSKKFIVQLSANISGGRGQFPATPIGLKRLEIFLFYGVEILTDDYFVLSQYTHLTDRQTDRQVNGQTELRQQYRALHYTQLHGKTNSYHSLVSFRRKATWPLPGALRPWTPLGTSLHALALIRTSTV